MPDPYRVWLSEIMLQQTSVAAVVPYYQRFLDAWPTLDDLAAAPVEAVLHAWSGLGYYARARNLHRCAVLAAARGGLPGTATELRALPGIGDYTAHAVAAIAFGEAGIGVDGNVERVAARLFALEGSRAAIVAAAQELGRDPDARARPGDFLQALFDLGATICTRRPACALCPWRDHCAGARLGIAEALPRRAPRAARPRRHGNVFVLRDAAGRVLLRRRRDEGLLGGMPELPGSAWRETAPAPEDGAPVPADWTAHGTIRHVFTHFELCLAVFSAAASGQSAPPGHWWEVPGPAGLPTLMRKAVAAVQG
jgi:A/G-specific adenine glycosylase